MSAAQTTSSIWLFLSAIAFMFVGLIYHPLFFACSIFLYAAAEAKRNRIAGILGAAFGLLFLLLVLGYGFGKDMALHENGQSSVADPGRAAA